MDQHELESIRPRHARELAITTLGVCLVAWSPVTALAAVPAKAPETTADKTAAMSGSGHEALRVTVDPHIEDAALIPGWVAERSGDVLDRLGEQPGHQRWVEVRIGGETYAYRVTVTAMRDGEPVVPVAEPVVCECTSEELLARIDGEVERAVKELERPVIEEPDPGEPEPGQPPDGEEPVQREPPPSWLLPTGAALTAVGGAGLVAGVVMIAVGEPPARAEGIQIVQGRDWRNPTGYVVLGVGAGVLAGGIALLVLHHRGCKRAPGSCGGGKEAASRRGPGQRDWSVAPWIGGGELGVGLSGRFYGRRG